MERCRHRERLRLERGSLDGRGMARSRPIRRLRGSPLAAESRSDGIPGVLPTYEDNEIQKIADMEDMLAAPMPLNVPLQGGLTLPSPGTTTPRTGAQQSQTEDNAQNRNPGDDDDETKKKPSPE